MISLSHIFSPLGIGDEKLLQGSFDESTRDVLTVFQGACSHPGFWEAMEDIQRFCRRNKEIMKVISRHRSGGMGHSWAVLETFDLVSCKETKASFGSALLNQKASIETSKSIVKYPTKWMKLSFCEMRVSQWAPENRKQMSDLCKSKGNSMICSALFAVVLLAKPSSFSNAFWSVCFLYVFYFNLLLLHCINSCSADHRRALLPVLGLQQTIPRSRHCANRAAARASQKWAYGTEIWAMRRWRLQLRNQGFRGRKESERSAAGKFCGLQYQPYANCHLTMQVV